MAKKTSSKKTGSSKPAPQADEDPRKIQKQIYITQDLIDFVEEDRKEREVELRVEFGLHVNLSWSQHVGSILHTYRAERLKAKESKQ